MDIDSAKAEFEARCKDPASLLDFEGPTEKYRKRLGVMTKTVVTFRNAVVKEQGFLLQDKCVKNATQGAFRVTNEMNGKQAMQQLVSSAAQDGHASDGPRPSPGRRRRCGP